MSVARSSSTAKLFRAVNCAGLANDVFDSLNGQLNKVLNHPDARKQCATLGIDPAGTSVEALNAMYRKWGAIVQLTVAAWD